MGTSWLCVSTCARSDSEPFHGPDESRRTRAGKSVDPIFSDGREATDPLFSVSRVGPARERTALVAYRLRRNELEGADLRVDDPIRGQGFDQSLY